MKRRSFLKMLGLAPAAAAVTLVPAESPSADSSMELVLKSSRFACPECETVALDRYLVKTPDGRTMGLERCPVCRKSWTPHQTQGTA